jgi:hypothetical protein
VGLVPSPATRSSPWRSTPQLRVNAAHLGTTVLIGRMTATPMGVAATDASYEMLPINVEKVFACRALLASAALRDQVRSSPLLPDRQAS